MRTKAHNSQVCCAFENALQMQPRAEKDTGGHYWICFEGTLPPLLISIRKLFLSDQVSAQKQQLEAILWMSLVKIFPHFCTMNWSLSCIVLCSHICANKQIEIDPGEISHKVAISVQPNKLKQYWRNIAQSGLKPESFLAFYPIGWYQGFMNWWLIYHH